IAAPRPFGNPHSELCPSHDFEHDNQLFSTSTQRAHLVLQFLLQLLLPSTTSEFHANCFSSDRYTRAYSATNTTTSLRSEIVDGALYCLLRCLRWLDFP